MKRYFIYARKSSESEEKQALSIEAQLFELKDFIKSKMPETHIVSEFTESKTAKEPGRAVFNKMISRIEKGEAEGIIAWHPDRLARNSVDGGKIIYLIDKGFIKFLDFPTYRFDNTAQGKFMLNIIFGQSKYYVDNLSENIRRGIRQKLRRGEWPGYASLGYTNNYKTRKIDIDPNSGPKIKQLFETYATGKYSLNYIVKLGTSIGLIGKEGGILRKNIINRILTNPIYYGNFIFKSEMYVGTHEPLISKELFDKVQEVLKIKRKKKQSKHNYVFRGLIKCNVCGCMVTAETQKGHFYYRCTKKKEITCDTKYLREEILVNQINQKLSTVCLPSQIIDHLKLQVRNEKKSLIDSCSDEIRQTEKTINDLENKANRLMDIYLEGTISKLDFSKRKGDFIDKKYLLQQKLNHLEKGQFVWLEHLEEFINGLTTVKNVIETDDLMQKREFLEKAGSNFYLKPTTTSEEARAGGSGATSGTGGGSKKQVTRSKNSVRLVFEFKNFWSVVAVETKKPAKNSAGSEESSVWWR